MTISAPGKLFLFGEYAVLRGAPAIVTAVDRRVVVGRSTMKYEVLLPEGAGVTDLALPSAVAQATGGTMTGLQVDLRAMNDGDRKLGLGSSAASAAALAATMLDDVAPHNVFGPAFNAHRNFQHGVGSGADVAASCFGGTIVCRPNADLTEPPAVTPLAWPATLQLFAVWTGQSADTRKLVAAVNASQRPLTHLARLAEAAVCAFQAGDVDRLLVLASDYDDAMGKLGAAALVPIRTRGQARLSRIVREFGAASKPSGAGGGDISLVFGRDLDPEMLRAALPHGMTLLDLQFDQPGLRRE